MVDKSLVGRCGLYCGACEIYRAYKEGGEVLRRAAEYFKCPPEKVRCKGCQVLTPECWGTGCEMVQCLNAKELRFCYECPDYERHACEKYEKFAEAYLKEDGVDLRNNLARIKAGEAERWLKESAENFRCPDCKRPLSYGAMKKRCVHCGKELSC
ncbi:MAG: DUF3795 domain-containing protein [Candidatus Bathyarchaeota archaeon]|nr:DUF3795 domain-containing protein [Candidatus Bathyarchaeota archaeon]